ncbi:MAG: nitroreductase family protein [Acidobacteriota bacterium]
MFERPAPTDHPIHDLLARRWSTRSYTSQSIAPATLRSLFEAARWAPSSGNGQPWTFLVARKEDAAEFEKLASTLNPGNAWAKSAAALAISVAALDRPGGNPNAHAWHDVGMATQNLILQATELGLSTHVMGGFSHEKAREVFAIPDRFEPVAAIAIGYPGDPAQLPEDLRKKDLAPRNRKPLSEFVFNGKWDQPGGLE